MEFSWILTTFKNYHTYWNEAYYYISGAYNTASTCGIFTLLEGYAVSHDGDYKYLVGSLYKYWYYHLIFSQEYEPHGDLYMFGSDESANISFNSERSRSGIFYLRSVASVHEIVGFKGLGSYLHTNIYINKLSFNNIRCGSSMGNMCYRKLCFRTN